MGFRMDSIDFKILELVEEDGGLSTKDLATMTDLSESDVESRLKKLRASGVLAGVRGVVDWKNAGKPKSKALIQVKVVPQEKHGFAKICREISRDDRVQDVFVVTGEYDLILLTEAESLDDISEFVTEKLSPKKEVMGTYTHIILSEFKRNGFALGSDKNKRLLLTP